MRLTVDNLGTTDEVVTIEGADEMSTETADAVGRFLNPLPVKATPAQEAKNTRRQYWRTFRLSPEDREKARVLASSAEEKAEMKRYADPGEAGTSYRKAVDEIVRSKAGGHL